MGLEAWSRLCLGRASAADGAGAGAASAINRVIRPLRWTVSRLAPVATPYCLNLTRALHKLGLLQLGLTMCKVWMTLQSLIINADRQRDKVFTTVTCLTSALVPSRLDRALLGCIQLLARPPPTRLFCNRGADTLPLHWLPCNVWSLGSGLTTVLKLGDAVDKPVARVAEYRIAATVLTCAGVSILLFRTSFHSHGSTSPDTKSSDYYFELWYTIPRCSSPSASSLTSLCDLLLLARSLDRVNDGIHNAGIR